jgi:predicted enzyme related to lactoylglutathione lyase
VDWLYSVQRVEVTLSVPSIERTINWYERVLGWNGSCDVHDEDGACQFGGVYLGEQGFNLLRAQRVAGTQGCDAVTLFIVFDDVDAVHRRVVERGGEPATELQNTFWGGGDARSRYTT